MHVERVEEYVASSLLCSVVILHSLATGMTAVAYA
ncbi:hypothetical protein SAMN05428985_108235 [Nocardioides sp. YR527]|nr:hypothetical protein SAMN05428985_108235 [Nocardioides sp. YR527]